MAIIDFLVELPVANPLKFTLDGSPTNKRANFDQIVYWDGDHTTIQQRDFALPLENGDPLKIKFYSNYLLNRVKVIDCEDNIYQTLTPSVSIDYRNKKYRTGAQFSSIDGKLFVYFVEGVTYLDEDFIVTGDLISLQGRLPNIRAVVGDTVRFKIGADFETTHIEEIVWSPTLQAEGYLLDADYTLVNPVNGLAEITYHEKDANLWERSIDLSGLAAGRYHVRLEFGFNTYHKTFTSEPIDVQEEHSNSLAIEYRHGGIFDSADLWSYIYAEGETNILRLPATFFKFTPTGDIDVDTNDAGTPRMLRAVPFREISFEALNIPSWVADKLQIIFSHDTKKLNGYYWENENFGNFEMIDRMDLGTYEIKLRQVNDRTKYSNAFEETVTASWTPSSFSALDFEGEEVEAVFNTNSVGVFSFRDTLPAWIEADKDTFVNGETVTFTIAANATAFARFEELVAVCPDLTGVEAPITFEQLHDDSAVPPEFIEVDDETVALGFAAGVSQLLSVSASSDYSITISGAWSFTAAKENGILNVRISEPLANNGSSNRTGTVRLALISNPAVFVDIAVSQIFRPDEILELTPAGEEVGEFPGEVVLDVTVASGTQWQASSSDTWLSFNTTIHTDSMTGFNIHHSKKPVYITERNGYVTFTNIANPSDYLVFNVRQLDGE